MNALLASGEVPGLYEGKELTALMAGCREAAQRDGVLVDSEDELFKRFTTKVGFSVSSLPVRCCCSHSCRVVAKNVYPHTDPSFVFLCCLASL